MVASTCRSKDSKGEFERTNDYVIACHSFRVRISQMKVVEDFESSRIKQYLLWSRERHRN